MYTYNIKLTVPPARETSKRDKKDTGLMKQPCQEELLMLINLLHMSTPTVKGEGSLEPPLMADLVLSSQSNL